jgi:predicted nuclease of predicted toxin-antitoxin system
VKFLVDNQLPAALARWLGTRGQDAIHVLDRGLGQANDETLWALALAEGRIVVSKDEDFFILATRPGDAGQLLWLRMGNCRTAALLTTLEGAWTSIEPAFQSGQKIVEVR